MQKLNLSALKKQQSGSTVTTQNPAQTQEATTAQQAEEAISTITSNQPIDSTPNTLVTQNSSVTNATTVSVSTEAAVDNKVSVGQVDNNTARSITPGLSIASLKSKSTEGAGVSAAKTENSGDSSHPSVGTTSGVNASILTSSETTTKIDTQTTPSKSEVSGMVQPKTEQSEQKVIVNPEILAKPTGKAAMTQESPAKEFFPNLGIEFNLLDDITGEKTSEKVSDKKSIVVDEPKPEPQVVAEVSVIAEQEEAPVTMSEIPEQEEAPVANLSSLINDDDIPGVEHKQVALTTEEVVAQSGSDLALGITGSVADEAMSQASTSVVVDQINEIHAIDLSVLPNTVEESISAQIKTLPINEVEQVAKDLSAKRDGGLKGFIAGKKPVIFGSLGFVALAITGFVAVSMIPTEDIKTSVHENNTASNAIVATGPKVESSSTAPTTPTPVDPTPAVETPVATTATSSGTTATGTTATSTGTIASTDTTTATGASIPSAASGSIETQPVPVLPTQSGGTSSGVIATPSTASGSVATGPKVESSSTAPTTPTPVDPTPAVETPVATTATSSGTTATGTTALPNPDTLEVNKAFTGTRIINIRKPNIPKTKN